MAPAKRNASSILVPDSASERSSASNSKRVKMTTTKPRGPRVDVSHACKERLDNVTRALNFKTIGSTVDYLLPTTMGAKVIAEITKSQGYENGGETIDWLLEIVRNQQFVDIQNAQRQLDWLLPIQRGRLQELTTELGFSRGGETIDWLLPMASKEFLELTHLLGFQDSANTIEWLLHQVKPVIDARIARYSAFTAGYAGTYSSPAAPPFSTPQFSQNAQAVRPGTFTPPNGLGGGTSPKPTPIQRNAFSSPATPIILTPQFSHNPQAVGPNTSTTTNALAGGTTATPTPRGGRTTQFSSNHHTRTPSTATPTPTPVQSSTGPATAQRADLPIPNACLNGFPSRQSQINGYGFQRVYISNNGMFNSAGIMQPMSGAQSQISTGKSQQASLQNIQVHNKVGSEVIRTDQEEKNRAACTGYGAGMGVSTPINNHPKHNAASVNYGDSGIKIDQLQEPPQLNTNNVQVQAPADQCKEEIRIEGKNPNYFNGGESWLNQFPIDLQRSQSKGEIHMAGQTLTKNQILEKKCPQVPDESHGLLNGGRPLAGVNGTNPVQENGKAMKERKEEVTEFLNMENETCS